jgi:leucyl-tRNA synthetase
MELVNSINKIDKTEIHHSGLVIHNLVRMLAPFAPHLAEELWSKLGNKDSVHREPWPKYDPKLIVEDEMTIPVQVNGKLRDTIKVPANADQAAIIAAAKASEKVKSFTAGKNIVKEICVPKKMVNLVVK